jgi:hypothetical protein
MGLNITIAGINAETNCGGDVHLSQPNVNMMHLLKTKGPGSSMQPREAHPAANNDRMRVDRIKTSYQLLPAKNPERQILR